jgi:flavorubredoxin
MSETSTHNELRAVEIADNIYWVGYTDRKSAMQCNPYLIIDGEEAVVIDGGSRPDFPTVMMKILSTGIAPSAIAALIYQHYDPDLCGSVPHFEDIISRRDLKIIASKSDHMFIRHYSVSSTLVSLDELDHQFRFSSGRALRFIPTPYAHNAGSYTTFDERSGVLFSSDLFGSYGVEWNLFMELSPECRDCNDYDRCPTEKPLCPIPDILRFHRKIFPSERALRFALEQMARAPFSMIAPQHGRIIREARDIEVVWQRLATLTGIGIDGLLGKRCEFDLDYMNSRRR